MKLRNVATVRDRIDDTFLGYCMAGHGGTCWEYLNGRLSGLLYSACMLGAIDTEEYAYLSDAVKAVDINWRKGVRA